LYLLASNQDTLQQLTGSLAGIPAAGVLTNEYLKATIYEGMRLYPAAWMTERVALEDDRVGEYSFPRGTIIISFLFGLHRDERLWRDASIFRPQRFIDDPGAARSGNFYPFGAGPRMCVGNNFAMVEMSLFLAAFFKQFQLRPTGQVPEMIARITLKPDRVILNSTKNA
jgi:cytochrome P450